MSLKKENSFFQTTIFRLTLWYAVVFGILSLLTFLVVYVSLDFQLKRAMDNDILADCEEFKILYKNEGQERLKEELKRESQSDGENNVFYGLVLADGTAIISTRKDLNYRLLFQHFPGLGKEKNLFQSLDLSGFSYQMRVLISSAGNDQFLVIGDTLERNAIILKRYRETFATAMVIMLVCAVFVGWLLARKAMSGVKRLTDATSRIGKHDFEQLSIIEDEGQEICTLIHAFNNMLKRIQSLLDELQQITDNIAHELRTPLTRIRGIAETTLRGSNDLDDFREMAALVIDGSDDLVELIATMLEIAKTDSGVSKLSVSPINFQDIVIDAIDLFSPVADDKQIQIYLKKSDSPPIVNGDQVKLQRVVANLLDNAIKYTPLGGTITISLIVDAAEIRLSISDTGIGIDQKDIFRIFDRFYRGDKSRSTSGTGLGLSLALAIAHAHQGNIAVKSTKAGTTFIVVLPRSNEPLPRSYRKLFPTANSNALRLTASQIQKSS